MSQSLTGGDVREGISKEREVFQRINEMRKVLNQTYEADIQFSTTGNNALTTAWTSPALPADGAWWLEARIIGFNLSASGSAAFTLAAGIEANSGSLSFIGGGSGVAIMQQKDDVTLDAQLAVSGTSVLVKVKDNSFPIKWRIHVSVVEVVK